MTSERNYLRITWIARSFLDYRIPVFQALDKLVGKKLKIVFSEDYVPDRIRKKIEKAIGPRAIGLSGEWRVGPEDRHGMANSRLSLRFHPGLFNTIRKSKPDILVADGFFKWTLAAIPYKLIHNVPLIICYERTFHTERNAQWFRTFYRRAITRLTDALCCNGQLCGEYSQWLGMDPAHITYGHMAADTEELVHKASTLSSSEIEDLRRKWNIQGILILYVGRLITLKGVRQLLEAWAKFEQKYTNKATLMLVGDGDLSDELKTMCRQRNFTGVRFVGSVNYDNIAKYYNASDVLIMPTLEDNWSLVVPEAMACGLPVLCSKYNGCWPELVHGGINGWVFDPLKPDDIMGVLEWCIDHRKDLKSMGEKSRLIVSDFSPENAAKSIFQACQIALARKKKGNY
jgi:glycosyltransferase involved in cell wall biosynthesis